MNHPRIETRELSNECIKAIIDTLITQHYAERDATDELGQLQARAALEQANKLQRFLDR